MNTLLISAGAAIIVALAAYAGWLHYRLWQRDKKPHGQSNPVATFAPGQDAPGHSDSQRAGFRKSIYLLADALVTDKMTHTEGCLRICAVAMYLEDSDSFRREYGVLFRVAEATAHLPILDDWQALSKEDKKRITREREEIESRYQQAVLEAAERIRRSFG